MSRQNKEFENKVIFHGNSPFEWKELKPKIINEFKGENCWELVNPKLGFREVELEDGSVQEYLVEYSFDEVEPNKEEFMEEKTKAFDKNIKNTCKESMEMIESAEGKTAEWKADEIYKVNQNKITMKSKRSASIEGFEKSFREVHTMWTRKQAEYLTKVASVIRVFNRCLAKGPKDIVALPFDARKFREAWRVLNEFYFNKLSESEIDVAVELKLMDLRYNEKTGLEGFLNQLNKLYSHSRNDQTDLTKKQVYLMHSLNESSHPFKDVLSNINVFASMESLDFNGIVEALRRRDVELKTEKRKKQSPNSLKDYAFHTDSSAPNHKKQKSVSDKLPWCTECDREGHTVDTCFNLVPCPICNRKGHGAKWCPDKKKKGNTSKSSGNGAANVKVSNAPKTRAMFQKNNPRKGKA
jgi:hypothetical protein